MFNYNCGDGPLSLVFEANETESAKMKGKKNLWRYIFAANLPFVYAMMPYIPPEYLISLPAFFAPTLYTLWNSSAYAQEGKDTV